MEIYRWLIYGNIWIALGACSFTYSTSFILYGRIDVKVLVIVFFATLIGYNYQRYISVTSQNNSNVKDDWFLSKINLIKAMGYLLIPLCLYLCLVTFNINEAVWFLPFTFIIICYRWPVLGLALRDLPYLKIFIISLTWGFITVLLVQFSEHDLNLNWMLILNNSLYILGITIPFDIRDLDTDSSSKKTIPQIVGVKIAVSLSIICLLISALMYYNIGFSWFSGVCIISAIVTLFSISKRQDWYYSFIIDGLLLLFPLFTIFKA